MQGLLLSLQLLSKLIRVLYRRFLVIGRDLWPSATRFAYHAHRRKPILSASSSTLLIPFVMKVSSLLSPARALTLGTLLIAAASCSVSEQVKDKPTGKNVSAEALENEAYTLMQYRLNFVDEAKLGGQDILFVRQASDIASPQQEQLQVTLKKGMLPLHLKMRVYARNPSVTTVQLKQLEYKLLLDGKPLTTGVTGINTELEASAIETLPITVDINVKPAQLAGSTPAAFAAGLTDFTAANRRLMVQIRPMYVGANGRQAPASAFETVQLVTAKKAVSVK
jgi:hypothetical protein